ncbi:MAG: heme-copper oxidase subunit III [Acidobacteriota bacterium]
MDAHATAVHGHAELEIPYNVHPRPDTGLYNAKLGVWLFLASEVMLFGALFSSYILLRTGNPNWPTQVWNIVSVPLATINTFVLIGSSVTVVMAWASLRLGDFNTARIYLGVTLLCGLIFMGIKSYEYAHKFEHHLYPSKSNYLAVYFTLTGLHGLHVLGGMIVFAYLIGPGAKMWKTDRQRYTNRIEVVGLYWHFVDLVWIFLFPTLYLL